MKKVIYILLLLVLVLQLGGMLLVFNIQQCIVRTQMKEKLESDATLFEKLILSSAEYKKSKVKPNEIFHDGKMFDVKSAIVVGDSVELLVINDVKEENILRKMKELANGSNSSNSKLPVQLRILTSLHYISPDTELNFFQAFFQIYYSSQTELGFVSNKPEILSPPPRIV